MTHPVSHATKDSLKGKAPVTHKYAQKDAFVQAPHMIKGEDQYLALLHELYTQASTRQTRNNDSTRSVFGRQLRFDMEDGFPLLTTKKVFWSGIVTELMWFLRGDTNIKWLQERGVHIWDQWADANGDLGPVYGAQWRKWDEYTGLESIDQIANVIKALKEDPYSRRHVVSAWNVGELSHMALPPCHVMFQFYVGSDERLSMSMYQRSADIFLGVPFNIASYALLLHIIAGIVERKPGEFVHMMGDVHLYGNHIEQAAVQLSRKPGPFPKLVMPDLNDLSEPKASDFTLLGYNPHPAILAPVSK